MGWRVPLGFEGVPVRLKGLLRDLEEVPVGLGTWVLGGGGGGSGEVSCL